MLSILFFFSGFSALLQEVAWERLLSLYYGTGPNSSTLIVSIFMLGLGLGAVLGGRVAENSGSRIKAYLAIECLLGTFAIVSLPLLEFLGRSTAGADHTVTTVSLFLFLCVPTTLMGMTLPILTKFLTDLTGNFLPSISLLYFANTVGAAVGAVFASFVSISFFGIDTTLYIAAAVNFALGLVIWAAGKRFREEPPDKAESDSVALEMSARAAHILVLVTGFLAISYQIIWFRLIGILVKASPYAFSTVLSVYLVGIGLGSYSVRALSRRNISRRTLFFATQGFLGLYALGSTTCYYMLTKHTPLRKLTWLSFSRELHPAFDTKFDDIASALSSLYSLLDVLLWPLYFVLVPALLIGAGFPLIAGLARRRSGREGETTGRVYFLTTVGNVAGGLVTGYYLLPTLGTERSILILGLVGLTLGSSVLAGSSRRARATCLSLFALLAVAFFPTKGALYDLIHSFGGPPVSSRFINEGRHGVVVTDVLDDGMRQYIGGLRNGHRPLAGYYFMVIEAMAQAKSVDKVLLIGLGTGSVLEGVLRDPNVKEVRLVEINEAVLENLRKVPLCQASLADPRLTVVVDDGRRQLLRDPALYDLILMDPLRGTTAYSNNLYSFEFFQLVSRRLKPGGVLKVWLPSGEVFPKTLIEAFPYVRRYEKFYLACNDGFSPNPKRRERLFEIHGKVWDAINAESSFRFLADQVELRRNLVGHPINKDWKPRGEYYLGLLAKKP